MRADTQPDVDLVAQGDIPNLIDDNRLPEAGHRHDVGVPSAFQLNHVRADQRRAHFLGERSRRSTELEGREPITVDPNTHIGGARIKARAGHPAQLSMRLHARSDDCGAGAHDEIPTYTFPHEMKSVVSTPDVRAGPAIVYVWG